MLGQLDDLIIVPGLIILALKLIPDEIVTDLEEIRQGIIDGTIDTGWEG